MALGASAYILAVPFIFPLLFPQYPESIAFTQVLALGLIFVPRSIYGKVLIAHKQLQAQYILSVSNASIKIFLLFILLPLYGVWGAIYAVLVTDLISAISVRYFFTNANDTRLAKGSAEDHQQFPVHDA